VSGFAAARYVPPRRITVEQRRTEILDATCRVVLDRGFAATRIVDVANELGVSTGLIHYHFESKEQLLAEAFRHAADVELEHLAGILDKAGDDSVARLDLLFNTYLPVPGVREQGWLMWIDAWSQALRSPELAAISAELDSRWQEALQQVIVEGVEAGALTCDDPTGTAWRMAALLDGLGLQVVAHSDTVTREQMLGYVRTSASKELGVDVQAFRAAGASRASPNVDPEPTTGAAAPPVESGS